MYEKLLGYLASQKFSSRSKADLIRGEIVSVQRQYRSWAREQLSELEKLGGSCVSFHDDNYPKSLKDLADPPPLLFMLGEFLPEFERTVAVVGARKCSVYGETVASRLGAELADNSLTLVSGLAYGIDEAAHKGFLSNGGAQVAVIGSGFSNIYPRSNNALAKDIVQEGGVLISEYPPVTAPHPYNFPARNRILAALSNKVVVVEARAKSGSLITADFALDLGRNVFVVPGQINSSFSEGTNKLLLEGASPYLGLESLELSLVNSPPESFQVSALSRKLIELPDNYRLVWELIEERGICSFDELCEKANLRPHKLRGFISELELTGLIRTTGTDHIVCVGT